MNPEDRPGPGRWGSERFRSVEEHLFDAEMVIAPDGSIIRVAAQGDTLFGHDLAGASGQDVFALVAADDVPALRRSFDDLLHHRRLVTVMALRAMGSDGGWIDVEIVGANHPEIAGVVVHVRDITERKRLEERIHEAERRHSLIIESLVDGVMMIDRSGAVVRMNRAVERMFGTDRARVMGRRFVDVLAHVAPDGNETVDEHGRPVAPDEHPLLVSLRTGRRLTGVVYGVSRPGEDLVWIRINSQAIVDGDGDPIGAVASFIDITEARRATAELHAEQRFLQVLLGNLEEGIVACDGDGRITVFNPAARRLHGLRPESQPIGKFPAARGLRRVDGSPMDAEENPLRRALAGERLRDVEMILEARSGERRRVSVNGQTLVDPAGAKLGAVVAIRDVTEQKRNEERLAEMALHDPLTGLANRTLLAERMRAVIEGLPEGGTGEVPPAVGADFRDGDGGTLPGVAVFLLDLDDFKNINDALGHDVGDDVLVAVSKRLLAVVRPTDTVARLGGDEFVVVCEVKRGDEELRRIAARIDGALAEPYRIDGRTLTVAASVGGVLVADRGVEPSKLLSRADDAMYAVKWSRRQERRSMVD
ncbi:MAG: PAS domain S-box protein [Actinomycetota bacterium]|nr:PAS domain S-box protein [Actinomycetota bacterium]